MQLIAYVYTHSGGLDLLGCTGINNSPLKDANNASDTLGKHKSRLSYLRFVVNCLQESHIRTGKHRSCRENSPRRHIYVLSEKGVNRAAATTL